VHISSGRHSGPGPRQTARERCRSILRRHHLGIAGRWSAVWTRHDLATSASLAWTSRQSRLLPFGSDRGAAGAAIKRWSGLAGDSRPFVCPSRFEWVGRLGRDHQRDSFSRALEQAALNRSDIVAPGGRL